MGIIPVEGLGQVEIEGDVPNAEEQQLILDLLEDQGSFSEAVESELSEAEGLEKIGGRSTFEAKSIWTSNTKLCNINHKIHGFNSIISSF